MINVVQSDLCIVGRQQVSKVPSRDTDVDFVTNVEDILSNKFQISGDVVNNLCDYPSPVD